MKSNSERRNVFAEYAGYAADYVRRCYRFLILFAAGFAAVSAVNFLSISTTQSVAAFAIGDFEIGQIADRTITAEKTLPPDDMMPVAVEKGERIIRKGFPVTEESYMKLQKMAASPVYIDYRAFSNNELYLFLVAVLWYLLFSFIPWNRRILLREPVLHVVMFMIVYSVTVFGGKIHFFSNPYSVCMIIPAVLCVMLVTVMYGQMSAVLLSFVMSLGILSASGWELVPFLHTLTTTFAAVAVVRKVEKRMDLVVTSIITALLGAVVLLFMAVVFNEPFVGTGKCFAGAAANGFISGILALGLLTPLELLMNTASVFRLMDLSDLNNPLMKKMLVMASGTYNHSMMVAQLAESACREIGANALLARVGAYYHDIGKIDQSEYFVENQRGENKHDDINPSLSVSVIRSHVKRGVEKAHQMRFPQQIVDIIAEHHGNSVIAYFYNEAKEKDPSVTPESFSYSGTPPTTRESAVVMLADTVEAACRTLGNPSVSRLEKFIQTLITGKIEHGQLDNCDLTFRDISRIKEAFVQVLAGYYHSRIEYPDQTDPSEQKKAPPEGAKADRNEK